MKPDQEDRARDEALDQAVQAHFSQARESIAVPSFEAVMAKAEAADAIAAPRLRVEWLSNLLAGWSAQARWAAGAAVGAVAALAVLVMWQTNDERAAEEAALMAERGQMQAAAEQQLLASIESTTRWQAPSDRWLAVESDIDIFGLPDIGGAEALKEEPTWL